MTILGRMFAVGVAFLIASPVAQARPRLGPGLILAPIAIVGGIAGAAVGSRKARAQRSYQHRSSARRDRNRATVRRTVPVAPPAAAAAATAPAPGAAAATVQAPSTPSGWAGPLFWPYAYDGVFEYAFGLPGDDNQFWARGFGDVIDGMFKPHRAAHMQQTGNRPAQGWETLCGSKAPNAADATVARIKHAVQLSVTQEAALNDVAAVLTRAIERLESVCPEDHAVSPPERLRMMTARLTAIRHAVLAVQGPLRTFYERLSDEQKAKLESAGSANEAAEARADARTSSGCGTLAVTWPQEQIERGLQPTRQQRALLEQLRRTSLGLAQFVASTCPAQPPRDATQRLDAIKERLGVLRYAASNVTPAFEMFYASLSEAQKARFQNLGWERRAESRR